MPQLCQNDSERALGMDQYGMTYQAVADHFNVSRIIIPRLNIIRRRQTGRTNDRPRNDRPRSWRKQGYGVPRFKSLLQKFYRHHYDMVDPDEISTLQMKMDVLFSSITVKTFAGRNYMSDIVDVLLRCRILPNVPSVSGLSIRYSPFGFFNRFCTP